MLAPATMQGSVTEVTSVGKTVFPLNIWHTLLQNVSYEPECQVWSIDDDALQPFMLS